jgi:dTMP kinase
MAAGKFITFEGGEGSGKSTQAQRLAALVDAAGIEVVLTREPGGTPFAEQVRNLILSGSTAKHGATAEALLFFAARADHVETLIRPALAAGKWVICDRFTDSTRVYQGAAGSVSPDAIESLNRIAAGATQPDLTLLLDIDAAVGLARATERRQTSGKGATGVDPYEQRSLAFHERLRQGYLAVAKADPDRCRVIDAGGTPEAVEGRIREAVLGRFGGLLAAKAN